MGHRKTVFAAVAILLSGEATVRAEEAGQTFVRGGMTIWYEVIGAGEGAPLVLVNGGPGFDHAYLHAAA